LQVVEYIHKAKRLGCSDNLILENIKMLEKAKEQGIKMTYEMFLLKDIDKSN